MFYDIYAIISNMQGGYIFGEALYQIEGFSGTG